MPNMQKRNYRFHSEIENLDEFLESIKTRPGKTNSFEEENLIEGRDPNNAKGLIIKTQEQRYYCSCGYVGDNLNSVKNPICDHCGNKDWVIFVPYKDNIVTTEVELVYDEVKDTWSIVYTKWEIDEKNDRKTIFLTRKHHITFNLNEKDFTKCTKDFDKIWGDPFFLTEASTHELLSILPFYKELALCENIIYHYPINFSLDRAASLDRALVLINYILTEGLDTFKDKFLKDSYTPDIFLYTYKTTKKTIILDSKKPILLMDDLKNKTVDDIARRIGFDKYDNFYLKSLLKTNIKTIEDTFILWDKGKNLKKEEEDILKLLINDKFFETYSDDIYNKFLSTLNNAEIFHTFYLKNKDRYQLATINVFLYNVNYCKENNIDLNFVNSNYFYSLLNNKNLIEMKIPEDKVKLFNHYIDTDPLKAYSFLANRKKLTKKEIKEYKKIIEL